ncbi:MAG TPA: sensor domain-containing diguanylate cyclase [Bacillota bacterium]
MDWRKVFGASGAAILLFLMIPAGWQERAYPAVLTLVGALAGGALAAGALPLGARKSSHASPAAERTRLEALYYTAVRLAANLDLEAVLDTLAEALRRVFTYENGAILVVDEATDDLVLVRAHNYDLDIGYRIPPGRGISGRVLRTRRAEIIHDVRRDPDYIPGLASCRSEICVPVLRGERALGVINIESTQPAAFGTEDLFVLTSLAEIAALAIDNARLHGETVKLAQTDAHTGLYNYRFAQECLREQLSICRKAGKPLTLMMIDLDHFKSINDRFGHIIGDAVLRQFGDILRTGVRQGDYVCRYGGEEFCIILPGADSRHAFEIADRLLHSIRNHVFHDPQGRPLDAQVTASIGLATYPEHADNENDLRRAADKALYVAKDGGRDRLSTGIALGHR